MSRRPARITQAEIARAIRAAKQEGATEIEVRIKDRCLIVGFDSHTFGRSGTTRRGLSVT